jgi:hypothetical protein
MTRRTRTKPPTNVEPSQTEPSHVRFPNSLLAVIDVAVQGPLGPGGIARRIVRHRVTRIDAEGRRRSNELIGAACQPTTTQPGPDHDTDPTNVETIPTVVCHCHGVAYAQHHGVTRCTHQACWPLQPGEPPTGGI